MHQGATIPKAKLQEIDRVRIPRYSNSRLSNGHDPVFFWFLKKKGRPSFYDCQRYKKKILAPLENLGILTVHTSTVYVLLCFIDPILRNRYCAGVSSSHYVGNVAGLIWIKFAFFSGAR